MAGEFQLKGYIENESGTPVNGVVITALVPNTTTVIATTSTDANGRWRFDDDGVNALAARDGVDIKAVKDSSIQYLRYEEKHAWRRIELVEMVLRDSGDQSHITKFEAPTLTADRTITVPDATGTIALTSDIAAEDHHAVYTDAEALAAGQDDATSDPLIDDDAAADGTEESFARKDHVHPKHHAKYTNAEAVTAIEAEATVVLAGSLDPNSFVAGEGFIDEDSMATDSDVKAPSQQSVKAYVDAQVAGGGGGLTEADQWRLTTNFTGDAAPITSNLERNDSTGFGKLGTGVSESSGVFSFPSTGIWEITFVVHTNAATGADVEINISIYTTVNDSAYASRGLAGTNMYAQDARGNQFISILFDVTNVSTHKVRFHTGGSSGSNLVSGSTDQNLTFMTFKKLGAT